MPRVLNVAARQNSLLPQPPLPCDLAGEAGVRFLIASFDAWLEQVQPKFRPRTKTLYRILWGRFARYVILDGRRKVNQINGEAVVEFLATLSHSRREQRERYQRVVEAGLAHVASSVQANSVTAAALTHAASGRPSRVDNTWRRAPANRPTQFLSGMQVMRLEAWLCARAHTRLALSADWRAARDDLAVALLLECGPRAQELTAFSVSCIVLEGDEGPTLVDFSCISDAARIRARQMQDVTRSAPASASERAQRRLPLSAWAARLAHDWLDIHWQSVQALGWDRVQWERSPLLPGVRPDRDQRNAKQALRTSLLMSEATLTRAVSRVGDSADLNLTAQRLRNTYGARLIARGCTHEDVARNMGYAINAVSAQRLAADWRRWCARHGLSESEQFLK